MGLGVHMQKFRSLSVVLHCIGDNYHIIRKDRSFVTDNVDHNIRTLDGHNTFHGMGMIATFTAGKFASKPIPKKAVTVDDIKAVGTISIKTYFQHTVVTCH